MEVIMRKPGAYGAVSPTLRSLDILASKIGLCTEGTAPSAPAPVRIVSLHTILTVLLCVRARLSTGAFGAGTLARDARHDA